MPTGRSLHIGINDVSAAAFPDAGHLSGPENDAIAMRNLATQRGFLAELIPPNEAVYDNVKVKLLAAAEAAKPGDIFLFTFAGHGTGKFDLHSTEPDHRDEALLLHDKLLWDNDLRLNIWPAFSRDVRVLMIADSCHSGTVAELFLNHGTRTFRAREISEETREKHLQKYQEFYRRLSTPVHDSISANVLLLAACGDTENTPDDFPNGVFTATLLRVLDEEQPKNYADLINKIRQHVGPQKPRLFPVPPVNQGFIDQLPFTI